MLTTPHNVFKSGTPHQKRVLLIKRGHLQKINEKSTLFSKVNVSSTLHWYFINKISTFHQHKKMSTFCQSYINQKEPEHQLCLHEINKTSTFVQYEMEVDLSLMPNFKHYLQKSTFHQPFICLSRLIFCGYFVWYLA